MEEVTNSVLDVETDLNNEKKTIEPTTNIDGIRQPNKTYADSRKPMTAHNFTNRKAINENMSEFYENNG